MDYLASQILADYLASIEKKLLLERLAIWFSHYGSCKKIKAPHRKLLMNPAPLSIKTHCLLTESFNSPRQEGRIGNHEQIEVFLYLLFAHLILFVLAIKISLLLCFFLLQKSYQILFISMKYLPLIMLRTSCQRELIKEKVPLSQGT